MSNIARNESLTPVNDYPHEPAGLCDSYVKCCDERVANTDVSDWFVAIFNRWPAPVGDLGAVDAGKNRARAGGWQAPV